MFSWICCMVCGSSTKQDTSIIIQFWICIKYFLLDIKKLQSVFLSCELLSNQHGQCHLTAVKSQLCSDTKHRALLMITLELILPSRAFIRMSMVPSLTVNRNAWNIWLIKSIILLSWEPDLSVLKNLDFPKFFFNIKYVLSSKRRYSFILDHVQNSCSWQHLELYFQC